MSLRAIMLATLSVSCLTSSVGTERFANRPIVWTVNDRRDVPTQPRDLPFATYLYQLDVALVRPLTRLLDLKGPQRARDVNALDEVPDSTWFTNRGELTVDQIRRGPNEPEGPEPHRPWAIKSTKVGGASVGFIIKDKRGTKYLLKFDPRTAPEMETGADIITQRLFWAVGYNVPQDRIVHFRREDLVLADDAVVKKVFGAPRPMTPADVDERLGKVNVVPGQQIRGMTSRYLSGVPIGGYPSTGVRSDDPNDVIAHEHRRDLRGYRVFSAWLGHTDVKDGNAMDIWVEDPANPKHHYVMHYLVDFGKALGVMAYTGPDPTSGFTYNLDLPQIGKSLFSVGAWRRRWEGIAAPALTGIGLFEAEHYDPSAFKSGMPYAPWQKMDRFDGFWAAKSLMRLTPAHIQAAVEQAQFTDPRATAYMTQTLIARQHKTARHWFEQVNPLDRFTLDAGSPHRNRAPGMRLCFDDLVLRYGLDERARGSRYTAVAFDWDGRRTGWRVTVTADARGRACMSGIAPGPSHDGYVILRVTTSRPDDKDIAPILVHLAVDPERRFLRIIGLRRQ